MDPVSIELQDVVNNLANKLAVANVQIAQLEVALEATQQSLAAATSAPAGVPVDVKVTHTTEQED